MDDDMVEVVDARRADGNADAFAFDGADNSAFYDDIDTYGGEVILVGEVGGVPTRCPSPSMAPRPQCWRSRLRRSARSAPARPWM